MDKKNIFFDKLSIESSRNIDTDAFTNLLEEKIELFNLADRPSKKLADEVIFYYRLNAAIGIYYKDVVGVRQLVRRFETERKLLSEILKLDPLHLSIIEFSHTAFDQIEKFIMDISEKTDSIPLIRQIISVAQTNKENTVEQISEVISILREKPISNVSVLSENHESKPRDLISLLKYDDEETFVQTVPSYRFGNLRMKDLYEEFLLRLLKRE